MGAKLTSVTAVANVSFPPKADIGGGLGSAAKISPGCWDQQSNSCAIIAGMSCLNAKKPLFARGQKRPSHARLTRVKDLPSARSVSAASCRPSAMRPTGAYGVMKLSPPAREAACSRVAARQCSTWSAER